MTIIEIERLISDAFRGGEIVSRELRLSEEEANYVRTRYAAASIFDMGENWYQLTF